MDRDEVIKRLKEHLTAKKNQNGCLSKNDKFYCIHYAEDFLMMKKNQARSFIEENFPVLQSIKGVKK